MATESIPELVGPEPVGIARYAREEPGRVALDLPGHQLTYAEIDQAADRLAKRLLADCVLLEAGGGTSGASDHPLSVPCVPVLVEGTAELLVAVEAVERAGLICVPLDPSTPDARVRQIVREVGAPLLLTDLRHGSIDDIPCRHPLLDGLPAPDERIRRAPGPVHSIVFTSGSTGQPKGILKPHNQGDTVSEFLRLGFGLDGALRVGMLTAGSVAASVTLLQIILENGFTIVAYEMRRQQESIGQWLRGGHIDVLVAVPTLLRHILSSLRPLEVIEGLRFVAVFGESTTWEDVGLLRRHLPPTASIFNIYAQAEAGTIAIMAVNADTPIGRGFLPVGHPLPGRTVSIVDEEGRPVPPGERGEIVVEAPSLSLGYWKQEGDAAGAFSKNEQGLIVVRTGDAGRLRPDGVLEHLGRLDHVVKIAGNRVDLAEIEAALTAFTHITDAVATTYVDDAGELRLRAFVVVGSYTMWNMRVLRGQLSKQLARPMLPDVIDVLDELPRLPNGKVDRQGLPTTAPRSTATWLEAGRPPTEALERELATLWENVLGVDDVGLDDDFFDLGGDSLRAVRLAELIERQLDLEMPAWMLIEHPTIAGLAASLGQGSPTNRVVTIQAAVAGTPVFVAHDNFGNLFGARQYLTAIGLEQPIYGLRAGAWEGRPVGGTLQEVAAEHVDEILSVQSTGPVLLFGQATGSLFAFEIARQLLARGADVPLLVLGGGSGPPLPLVPGPARLGALGGLLAALPRREVPGAMARIAVNKGKQLGRRLPIRAGSHKPYEREDGEPLTAEVEHALQLYGAMAQRYRPPSHYPGPVLLIKPSWVTRPIEDRWRHWVDGPLRLADVEELRADLFGRRPRRLESLAPPSG